MPVDYSIPAKFGQLRTGMIDPMTLASLRAQVDARREAAAQRQQEYDLKVAEAQRQNMLAEILPQTVVRGEDGGVSINEPAAAKYLQVAGPQGVNDLANYAKMLRPDVPGAQAGQRIENYTGPESMGRFGSLMVYPSGKTQFFPQERPVKDTSGMEQKDRQFTINTELKLADDYTADSKDYATVKRQYGVIKKALSNPSAIGTLASATAIMKMLDPGSVVRESELGMAMKATGALDRYSNLMNVVESGQVLTPDQKREFGALTDQFMAAYTDAQRNINARYMERANSYGLNARNIIKFPIAPVQGDVPMESRRPSAPKGGKPKPDAGKLGVRF